MRSNSGTGDGASADGAKDYKDTLHLPITDFPMKGDLPVREPKMIAKWNEIGIYERLLEKNAGRPQFVMPDGPPYANGQIHIGHALNKCLKDFTIKYRNLSGKLAAFVPGWDCHGLPIEHKVTKDLGSKRKDKTEADIRELCRNEAKKWVGVQKEQFIRLGVMADWEHPYLTLDPVYEAEEVRELARCLERGVLYRGEKPVYWCPALQTALAEAEVEYAPHKSPSIYVKFPFENAGKKFGPFRKPVSIAIWTTTPWTLPANLGVCLHPDFDYGFFDSGDDILLLAVELRNSFEKETGLSLSLVNRTFKGHEFDRMEARHPFYERTSLVMLGDHVTLDAGTGCVHTAPGHGQDDYNVGLKYGLKPYSPVDAAGCFTKDVPEYLGIKIWDANEKVVERLRVAGRLLAFKMIEHSYPHNWRSHTPLIFRATPQWFLGMDLPGTEIRKTALAKLDEIKFVPEWGEARLRAMITNRPDWTLSRQRIWGVPIPVFYCTKCDHAIAEKEVMLKVADAMEAHGGIEAYHALPVSAFIGEGRKCEKCQNTEFRKGQDILDVWFDSGVCHAAVQKRRPHMAVPADIYLEGSDQHRGWFQTSFLSSLASTGESPFKALVTHGFVNDAQGRKMSKSLGNVVDPAQVIAKSGAEIVRLWAAYEDFGDDLSCGNDAFARVTETYRRFRNTMRFLLGNLGDFNPEEDAVEFKKLSPFDQAALARLNELIKKATDAYDNYEFYKVYHLLNHFFTVELSAGYLDMMKDRLYTWKKDGVQRRGTQTVLYTLVQTLVTMMAPITSFLAEEVYGHLPGDKKQSVFLTEFPKPHREWEQLALLADFDALTLVKNDVSKALEDLRREKVIGSGLDAQVILKADGATLALLQKYQDLLPEFFIVSQVHVQASSTASIQIETKKADGEKCARCWYFSTEIGKSEKHPTVCPKCVRALE